MTNSKHICTKALLFVIAILVYSLLICFSLDADMYFTISSGNDILSGNFGFNTHTNTSIVVQQWLYAVILALIHNKFSFIGSIIFVFLQDLLLFGITYYFLQKYTKRKFVSMICSILLIIITFEYMINIRPQIITMIMLLTEIIILDKYNETKKSIYLLWLVPLLVLYANLHQAVFLYCVFVAIPFIKDRKTLASTVCMPLLSIFTPYQLDGSYYIYRTFKSKAFDLVNINELNPLTLKSFSGIIVVFMIVAIIWLNYMKKSNRYINYYSIAIFMLSLLSIRHTSIIYIPLVFITIELIKMLPTNIKHINTILTFICVITAFISFSVIRVDHSDKTLEFVNGLDIPLDTKIYNSMNIGSYLEYVGYTDILLDARPELYTSYYNNEKLKEYCLIDKGLYVDTGISYAEDQLIMDHIKKYDYIIIDSSSRTNYLLADYLVTKGTKYNIYKLK